MFDIVVVGAGIAGLICAQQLVQAGYKVAVVEKSRGLGGRVATRRLHNTCADHGLRYLEPKGQLLQLIQTLCQQNLLQIWQPVGSDPYYVAPAGMSGIAKFLAAGLEIKRNQRVEKLNLTTHNSWCLNLESTEELIASAIVIAIPAPQALLLLAPLADGVPAIFLDNLRSVKFAACFSVIAGYPDQQEHLLRNSITFSGHPDLSWIGLDSSKRQVVGAPVFVVQSSAEFAERYLEAGDVQLVGKQLLNRAAQNCFFPWLDTPEWMEVHRWRYAFPSHPWQEAYLSAAPLPLVCCGDWCGGNAVESAMLSGIAAAEQINAQLQQRLLPANFSELLERIEQVGLSII